MRVISGSAKGRHLVSPGEATRPITDRVKESLFSILSPEIGGSRVLDLFAGAGSVGIEALSRGAGWATFVEKDRKALYALEENLRLTRLAGRATIARQDVFKFLRASPNNRYDLVYIAPPQYHELWIETLRLVDAGGRVSEGGVAVVQIHPKEFQDLTLASLELTDERKYGSTLLLFYRLRQDGSS